MDILRMGLSELFFKISYLILWIVYVLIRVPHDQRYKQTQKKGRITSAGERIFIVLGFIGLLILPLLWVLTPWIDRFALELPQWLRLLGIAFAVASLWFFWWVHNTLGANWSPTLEIRTEHELIVTGPYKKIRHPMYLQIWMWVIACSLIISNILVAITSLVAWTLMYRIRVRREEQMMIEEFGDRYILYKKNTGRIFPKLF